ncbi:MAG: ABC transporter substrate-binding protein [Alphaproteobacteria bacterium]|nr:ABC transporter substrate-binding protein [Alphaproteobacteria bacterium]
MTLFPTSGFISLRAPSLARTAGWLAKSCLVVAVLAGLTFESVRPASATETAKDFVNTLAEKALAIAQADAPPEEQRAEFSKLLDSFFDMPGIAEFLAGRYWRTASEDDRKAYFEAFHASIVNTYTNRFGDYSGQQLNVTGSREDGRFVLVNSEIVAPGGQTQPVKVDWRLLPVDGSFKVVDVVIEGVSMSVTQRQEYTALIQSNGGKLAALTEALDQKNSRVK